MKQSDSPQDNEETASLTESSSLTEVVLEEIDIEVHKESKTQETEQESLRWKRFCTATYCVFYVSLGFAVGALGPTLWALAIVTGSTVEELGSLFSARGTGWLIGSLAAGKLFEMVNGHRIMCLASTCCSIAMLLMPFVPNFWLLMSINFIMAIFMAFIDVGANTMLIAVWKEKATPYLQFLHFAFGVGATASPFLIGVFVTLNPTYKGALSAYYVLGVIVFLLGIPSLLLHPPKITKPSENEGSPTAKADKIRYYMVAIGVSVYLFLYVGAETSYGGWIFTYAVKVYEIGEAEGAYISSLFWFALTAGRLLGVPISLRFTARQMLVMDMIGGISSIVVLMAVASLKEKIFLWIFTGTFGLSMASIFATAFGLPSSLGIDITSRAASIMIVGASMGDMSVPMIVGWLVGGLGAHWLLIGILLAFIFATLVYVGIVVGVPRWYNRAKGVQNQTKTEEVADLIEKSEEDSEDVQS